MQFSFLELRNLSFKVGTPTNFQWSKKEEVIALEKRIHMVCVATKAYSPGWYVCSSPARAFGPGLSGFAAQLLSFVSVF